MKPNLVDRDIYKLKIESKGSKDQQAQNEFQKSENVSKEELAVEYQLLNQKISEKLKFVLSDKDTFDPWENQKKTKKSKQIQISAKYRVQDKIRVYGGGIEDPFKINLQNINEIEKRVFTAPAHQRDPQKRLMAIDLINKTFDKAKEIHVGMQKPGKSNVYAKKVYNIFPQFDALPHRVLHVMNDDKAGMYEKFPIINASKMNQMSQSNEFDEVKDQIEAMKDRYKKNNGQMLVNFVDKVDDEKKLALYKFNHQEKMPSDLVQATLGKRGVTDRDLEVATHYEFVRDYGFTQ